MKSLMSTTDVGLVGWKYNQGSNPTEWEVKESISLGTSLKHRTRSKLHLAIRLFQEKSPALNLLKEFFK